MKRRNERVFTHMYSTLHNRIKTRTNYSLKQNADKKQLLNKDDRNRIEQQEQKKK